MEDKLERGIKTEGKEGKWESEAETDGDGKQSRRIQITTASTSSWAKKIKEIAVSVKLALIKGVERTNTVVIRNLL